MHIFSDNRDDMTSLLLKQGYDYWTAKRGQRLMPSRADIDPIEIPQLLPWLYLVDVLEEGGADLSGGGRFKVRLVGTGITKVLGRDITALSFEEAYEDSYYDMMVGIYTELCRRKIPCVRMWQSPHPEQGEISFRSAIFPLSANGRDVNMALGLMDFIGQRAGKKVSFPLSSE